MENLELLYTSVLKSQIKRQSGTQILIPGCLIDLVGWSWISPLEPMSSSD